MLNDSIVFFRSKLFHDVQTSGIFSDSKTFADALPRRDYQAIYTLYAQDSLEDNFDLHKFVHNNFRFETLTSEESKTRHRDMPAHIETLWEDLLREADPVDNGSRIALKSPYIVPGGRFQEIYYWDSYFTALGLVESGKHDLLFSMLSNFIDIQNTIGIIPNGNRFYYWSRSQPPVFALMVQLGIEVRPTLFDSSFLSRCIATLEKEYSFWMEGQDTLSKNNRAHKRVVLMPDGEILNRYWDNSSDPRPESYSEDIALAKNIGCDIQKACFYRNVRAACESGWDFSSRWMSDPESFETIRTTDFVPVDLNSLLVNLEELLAQLYEKQANTKKSLAFLERSVARKKAINHYMYCEQRTFYYDYDIQLHQRSSVDSLAAAFPLFFKIATQQKALGVANRLRDDFLFDGGLVTTPIASSHQWDAPNGWAPLQWISVVGLQNYGFDTLAKDIRRNWLKCVDRYFAKTGMLMEKYDVVNTEQQATGGEYEVQHGFGWTNGVTLKFLNAAE